MKGSAELMILIKKDITDAIKQEALKLAETYGSNIQIQIDIKQDNNVALMRITEYNL